MRVFHNPLKRLLILIFVILLTGGTAVGLFIYFGIYNVSAINQHTRPVYDLLELARKRAITVRAKNTDVPALTTLDYKVNGLHLYEKHCIQCHGAPGVAPEDFSLGMMPAPSAIVKIGLVRSPEEIFWVIKNGVKMSGMPAWAFRLTETEHWQLVSLIKQLPFMTSSDYRELRTGAMAAPEFTENPDKHRDPIGEKLVLAENQVQRGKLALLQYNCATCHIIPGITASETHIGPPLHNVVNQSFIAGRLPNTDSNLVAFIRFPTRHKENTMMPNLGVDLNDAKAIVGYLRSMQQ